MGKFRTSTWLKLIGFLLCIFLFSTGCELKDKMVLDIKAHLLYDIKTGIKHFLTEFVIGKDLMTFTIGDEVTITNR